MILSLNHIEMADVDTSINESHNTSKKINKDVIKEKDICKYCREDLNEITSQKGNKILENICKCKGSIGYICKSCLWTWVTKSCKYEDKKNIICVDCLTEINYEKIFLKKCEICSKSIKNKELSYNPNISILCSLCYIKDRGILKYLVSKNIKTDLITISESRIFKLIIFLIYIMVYKFLYQNYPGVGGCYNNNEKYFCYVYTFTLSTFNSITIVFCFNILYNIIKYIDNVLFEQN